MSLQNLSEKKFYDISLFKATSLVLLILLMLCGCKSISSDEKPENSTSNANTARDTNSGENSGYKVTDNVTRDSIKCEINKENICVNTEAHYPSFGLPAIDTEIANYTASAAAKHILNLEADYNAYYKQETDGGNTPESITPFSFDINYTITYNAADGIYIVFNLHDDSNQLLNGRDIDGDIEILMFNPIDGSVITPESLVNLDDEGVLKKLSEMCTEALKKDLAGSDNVDPDSINVIPDKTLFKKIAKIPGGLRVYFYTGDVSSWAFSNVYVDIPW